MDFVQSVTTSWHTDLFLGYALFALCSPPTHLKHSVCLKPLLLSVLAILSFYSYSVYSQRGVTTTDPPPPPPPLSPSNYPSDNLVHGIIEFLYQDNVFLDPKIVIQSLFEADILVSIVLSWRPS